MTFNLFNTRFAMFASMISLSLLGEPLAADKVHIVVPYFHKHLNHFFLGFRHCFLFFHDLFHNVWHVCPRLWRNC